MSSDKPRLGLWLLLWAYMVVTLVVPLALAAGGVWDWGAASAVTSAFWVVLFVVMAIVPELRPQRRTRRARRETRSDGDTGE